MSRKRIFHAIYYVSCFVLCLLACKIRCFLCSFHVLCVCSCSWTVSNDASIPNPATRMHFKCKYLAVAHTCTHSHSLHAMKNAVSLGCYSNVYRFAINLWPSPIRYSWKAHSTPWMGTHKRALTTRRPLRIGTLCWF